MSIETKDTGSVTYIGRADAASQSLSPTEEHADVFPSNNEDQSTRADLVVFHKDYDLTLRVRSGTEFKVIEVNISSASDAFNNLLYKINTRSKEGAWVINLPNDNPEALKVIMQIIHFKFGDVPKSPTIDELFEICLLVSKYDCTHLIQPWAEKWSALLEDFANNVDAPALNCKALWVAWVLGCVRPFRDMVDSIILTSNIDEHGNLLHASGIKLEDLVLPDHLLDGIVETRSKTLCAILDALRQPMAQMSGMSGALHVPYCKVGGTDSSKCEMMMFASALPTLTPAGLFPIKEYATYSGSITGIKNLIYSIKYEAWEGKNHAPHKAHTNCNLGFKGAVKTILDSMSSPVQKKHLVHLAKQAEITGVSNGNELVGYGIELSAAAPEFKPAEHADSDKSKMIVKTESASDGDDLEVNGTDASEKSEQTVLTHASDASDDAEKVEVGEQEP